jgi:hypothetical protein
MHAFFDSKDGNPKVVIEISGTAPNSKKTINALLDTGHSGSLSLPVLDLISIGAKLESYGEVEYANGYTGINYYFSVNVTIDGITKEVQASMIENPSSSEAIAGLELFAPYVALIDFKNKIIGFIKEEELEKMKADRTPHGK